MACSTTTFTVNHSPRTKERIKNDSLRYDELYDFYIKMYASEQKKDTDKIGDETRDRAQVHAWLTIFAETGRLFVKRTSRRGRWNHTVYILDYNGHLIGVTCGFITAKDVALRRWDHKYVRWTEKVDEHHSCINLMTATHLPEIPFFQRADGKQVYLGWNNDHNDHNDRFECFDIILHNKAIEDNFD